MKTQSGLLFKIGDILRYSTGETALLQVIHVNPDYGGIPRYWGRHCMGGSVAAYQDDCSLASATDLETWAENIRWRDA